MTRAPRHHGSVRWGILWDIGALVLAGAATLWIASKSSVGRVVVTLSATHGVHAGDVLAAVAAFGLATSFVLARRLVAL